MAEDYDWEPVTEEQAVRELNRPEPAPVSWEQVDFSRVPMADLWQIAKVSPPAARRRIMVQLYGGKTKLEPPTPLERIGHGASRVVSGLESIPKEIKDYFRGTRRADDYRADKALEEALYQQGRGSNAGLDWWSALGEFAALSPMLPAMAPVAMAGSATPGLLGLAQQMAGQAATGALTGAIPLPGENQSRAGNAAVSGATGALMPPLFAGLAKAGGYLGNQILNKVAELSDVVTPPQGVLPRVTVREPGRIGLDLGPLKEVANRQLAKASGLTDDMLRRKGILEDLGFTDEAAPMIGQLTRDPALFSTERNLARIGGLGEPGEAVAVRLQNQARQFQKLEDRVVGSTSARMTGRGQAEAIGERGVDAIQGWWNQSQKAVGKLYQDIERQHGDVSGIDLTDFIRSTQELAQDESLKDVTKSVFNRLRARGLMDDAGQYTGQALTVSEARGLRTWIGNLNASGSLKYAKRNVIDALDDAVINGVGDDFFKGARDAARERFRQGETRLVRQVLQGTLQPNQMVNRMRNASARHLEEMQRTFTNAGEEGLRAWDELRGQTLFEVFNKNLDGAGNLGSGFVKDLEKIGNRKGQLLWPERWGEIVKIKDAVRALNIEPNKALSSINYSNTATALLGMASRLGVSGDIASGLQRGLKDSAYRKAAEFAVNPGAADIAARQALTNRITGALNAPIPGFGTSFRGAAPVLAAPFATPALQGLLETRMKED